MDRAKFYNNIRDTFSLTTTNVKGFEFILDNAEQRKTQLDHMAYILATTWHETASTMQPIAEYGKGNGKQYGKKDKYGQIPYGRGYVQLTWTANYERADKELGLNGDLIRDYNLALNPIHAVQILFIGMEEGWFTGKKLSDYVDGVEEDYKEDLREFSNARRIINGTDKQVLIGQYAVIFDRALRASGYLEATPLPEPPKIEPVVILEPTKPIPTQTEVVLTLTRADLDKTSLLDLYIALKELIGDTK